MSEGEVSLIGTLERVVFSNPENGFLIGTFLEENTVSPITIKGVVFEVQDQQKLHLKGNWENLEKGAKTLIRIAFLAPQGVQDEAEMQP